MLGEVPWQGLLCHSFSTWSPTRLTFYPKETLLERTEWVCLPDPLEKLLGWEHYPAGRTLVRLIGLLQLVHFE